MKSLFFVLILVMMMASNAYAKTFEPAGSSLWSPETASDVGQFIASDESIVENKNSLFHRVYLSSSSNSFNSEEDFTDIMPGLCPAELVDGGDNINNALSTLRRIPNVDGLPGKILSALNISPVEYAKGRIIPESLRPLYDTIGAYRGLGNSLYKMTQEPSIGNYFSTVRAIPGIGLFKGHTLVLESFVYGEVAYIENGFSSSVDKYLEGQDSGIQKEIDQYWKTEGISASKLVNSKSLFNINTSIQRKFPDGTSISTTLMNKSALPSSNLNLSNIFVSSPKYPNINTISDVTRMYVHRNSSVAFPNTTQLSNLGNYNKSSSSQFTTRQLNTINMPRQSEYNRLSN